MSKLISLAVLTIFLATPAMAGGTKTVSVTTTVTAVKHGGGDRNAQSCWPVTGNWVNAATTHCPDRGYGPGNTERSASFTGTREVKVPCNRNEKNS